MRTGSVICDICGAVMPSTPLPLAASVLLWIGTTKINYQDVCTPCESIMREALGAENITETLGIKKA